MRHKWKPDLVCLEIVLILSQDGCTICVERTAGTETILGTPDGTPDLGHMESHFGPFGYSVSVGAR
jgi:hypothetical protein